MKFLIIGFSEGIRVREIVGKLIVVVFLVFFNFVELGMSMCYFFFLFVYNSFCGFVELIYLIN